MSASKEGEESTSLQQRSSTSSKQSSPKQIPSKSRRLRKDSLENLDADPWASPELHKSHTHIVENKATPPTNGVTAARPTGTGLGGSTRTTSTFTTHEDDPSSAAMDDGHRPPGSQADGSGPDWGSYGNDGHSFSHGGTPSLGAEGFEAHRDNQNVSSGTGLGRSVGGSQVSNRGVEETVTVTLLPDKEGMFLFQHRNYEVKCVRRTSSVVRRYSDFVWLLDCLHKRYPFRQLPLLPPKRVAGKKSFYYA